MAREARWLAPAAVLLAPAASSALEPRSLTEPDVLREPAMVTQVVDGFEGGGGLDFHLTLGYENTWKRATIVREVQGPSFAAAERGALTHFEVGDYAQNTSRLHLRADLGLFRDLALVVRLPIILSQSARLEGRELPGGALDGAPGEPLFSVPFRSPNRSGVEYLAVGVDWGILNQWRNAAEPTLLVGAAGRFSVSEPMHACGPAGSLMGDGARRVSCAYPNDIDRDGAGGRFPVELAPGRIESLEGAVPAEARKAGVSRGTTALELHGSISRRFGQIEPYVGAGVLLEFPNAGSDFGPRRFDADAPPTRTRVSVGAELMPWEVVEQFQRLSIDLRFDGTFHSAGRDYSELFDALGSSAARSYRLPSFGRYMANPDPATAAAFPSVVDPDSARVFATGMTRVEAYGEYALHVTARWQAGEYVHFDLGGGFAVSERHAISGGLACDGGAASPEAAGPCAGAGQSGTPNPNFRPETDAPGRRFVVDTATTLDAWVGATIMF